MSDRDRLRSWPAARLRARAAVAFWGADGEEAGVPVARVASAAISGGSSARRSSPARSQAAGSEAATGRRIDHVGRPAGDGLEPGVAGVFDPRDGIEQRLGVGVLHVAEQAHGVSAVSTTRPPYMTAMRSARPATTPRSWVMRIIAMCSSRLQVLEQVEDLLLHGDVERGGRLVGDEQLGIAATARWRCRCAGACRPTVRAGTGAGAARARGCRRGAAARAHGALACSRESSRWKRSGSVIWRPTRLTGLSEVIGSWKTMAIWVPQKWRRSALDSERTSLPSKLTPPVMFAVRGRMFMIERTSTDLPEPDSPTMPSVSPRSRVNETSSTARKSPRVVQNSVVRCSTSRIGPPPAVLCGFGFVDTRPPLTLVAALPTGCGGRHGIINRIGGHTPDEGASDSRSLRNLSGESLVSRRQQFGVPSIEDRRNGLIGSGSHCRGRLP